MSKLVDSIVLNLLSAYIYKKTFLVILKCMFLSKLHIFESFLKIFGKFGESNKIFQFARLTKFVVKMYLAVSATSMYTQTLPDYTYASQISAYKCMLWGGGGGDGCDILSVSDFSVPKPLHIHTFFEHSSNISNGVAN